MGNDQSVYRAFFSQANKSVASMIKSSKYESAETGAKKQKEVKKAVANTNSNSSSNSSNSSSSRDKENSCPEPAEDQMDEETLR
jgi:hypothetical protein